jgi:hypothetical protein
MESGHANADFTLLFEELHLLFPALAIADFFAVGAVVAIWRPMAIEGSNDGRFVWVVETGIFGENFLRALLWEPRLSG